jgi:hypothetical protein
MNGIVKLGNQKILEAEDLFDPIDEHKTDYNVEKFEK